MKKALVFLVSFMISTMVVYSVYYYSNVGKLRTGLVASAEELPHTVINPDSGYGIEGNFIRSTGLMQAMGNNDSGAMVPSASLLVYNGEITRDVENELNEELSQKFPKHPPVGFPNIEKGEQVLFSYFFKNLQMPRSFTLAEKGIELEGEKISALVYNGGDSAVFMRAGDRAVLKVNIADDYVLYYVKGFQENVPLDTNLFSGLSELTLNEKQIVLVPELDFFIVKKYTSDELKMNVSDYKLVEERVKFKTTVDEGKKPIEGAEPVYTFDKGTQVLLIRKQDSKPYFSVRINHPEILLVQKENK